MSESPEWPEPLFNLLLGPKIDLLYSEDTFKITKLDLRLDQSPCFQTHFWYDSTSIKGAR